jgi:hypothetical protein
MKIVAVSRPVTRPLAELAPLLPDEARKVWELYAGDVIREQYLRDDGGVVLVLEAANVDAAQQVLGRLPLVANGFLEFDVWAVTPFTPWGRLMNPA